MLEDVDQDVLSTLKRSKRKKSFQEAINQSELSPEEMDELFIKS